MFELKKAFFDSSYSYHYSKWEDFIDSAFKSKYDKYSLRSTKLSDIFGRQYYKYWLKNLGLPNTTDNLAKFKNHEIFHIGTIRGLLQHFYPVFHINY